MVSTVSTPDASGALAFFIIQIVIQIIAMLVAIELAFGLFREKE